MTSTNNYFAKPDDLAPATKARSVDINAITQAINGAFDKVPDEALLKTGTLNYAANTGGAANAYLVTLNSKITSLGYVDGLQVTLLPGIANTGACTLNVNSLGNIAIKRPDGTAAQAGDLLATAPTTLIYSAASNAFMLPPLANAQMVAASASATAAATSATAAAQSASNAAGSASTAVGAANSAGTSYLNAAGAASAASGSATAASTSAGQASSSASAAATSASNAGGSATAAAGSATAASTSASAASTSATAAAGSATAASTSASNAAGSATAAATSAGQASTSAGQASTSATSAASSASGAATSAGQAAANALIAKEGLAALASTFHIGTIVKAFLYDTSKDSDGGAWRKRCAHTSWENEALVPGKYAGIYDSTGSASTAGAVIGDYYQSSTLTGRFFQLTSQGGSEVYRGNTRQFPAVALIVVESARVVIYDATQTALPMWMVSLTGVQQLIWGVQSITSAVAFNGKIFLGKNGAGVSVASFIDDVGQLYWNTGMFTYNSSIVDRNASKGVTKVANAPAIVNLTVNDVASVALPDAPIDPATGLPTPTIAVATGGGVSVIKQDGTAVNSSSTAQFYHIGIGPDYTLYAGMGVPSVAVRFSYGIGTLGASFTLASLANNTVPPIWITASPETATQPMKRAQLAHGKSNGLGLWCDNPSSNVKGMVSYITNAYNSGWQVGDSRGAYLADIVPEILTASGELVTNGAFVQDTTGWTTQAGTIAINGNVARLTATGTNPMATTQIATTAGKQYTISAQIVGISSPGGATAFATASSAPFASGLIAESGRGTAGSVSYTFTATGATSNITLRLGTGSAAGDTLDFDNISVKETAGVNLVTNGTFDTTTTGWGASSSWAASMASVGGEMQVTPTVNNGRAVQTAAITTVIGKQYTVTGKLRVVSGANAAVAMLSKFADGGGPPTVMSTTTSTTYQNFSYTFMATATAYYLAMGNNSGTVSGDVYAFDSLEFRDAQNLVLNPTFDVDTSSWTAANNGSGTGAATIAMVGNKLRVTCNGQANAMAVQTITGLTIGHTYQLQADVDKGTAVSVAVQIMSPNYYANTAGAPATLSFQFTATATSHQISLQSSGSTVGQYSDFDNVSFTDVTELVTNGQFDGMLTGWSSINNASLTVTAGQLTVTNDSTGAHAGGATQAITTIIGRTYRLTADCIKGTAANVNVGIANTPGGNTIAELANTSTALGASLNFTATSATTYVSLYPNSAGASLTATFDNISVKQVDVDRSVKNNGLVINGSLTKAAVATGAQLVGYSGFSAANYLEQPYNANLDFGTGDFSYRLWATLPAAGGAVGVLLSRGDGTAGTITLQVESDNRIVFYYNNGGSDGSVIQIAAQPSGVPLLIDVGRAGGNAYMYVNGIAATPAAFASSMSNPGTLRIGLYRSSTAPHRGMIAMVRASATAPSSDQIAQIYRDELALFQAGAQCVIDGTSTSVTALSYDEVTDLLHVGAGTWRSAFRGLQRVNSESTAATVGTVTSLGAVNGAVIIGGGSAGRFSQPAITLRDELRRKDEARRAMTREKIPFDFDGIAAQTAFTLPLGFTTKDVFVAGTKKRLGSTKDYTTSFDGYRESVNFGAAPGTVWVQITANRSN